MLFNPNTAPAGVLNALAQLETHPDYQQVKDYLKQCLHGEQQVLADQALPDMAAFGRQQGRVNLLRGLIEMSEGARTRLQGMQQRMVPRPADQLIGT